MIKSMTGFGKMETFWQGTPISVEVRSVNHRYREVVVRLPKAYVGLEEHIKQLVCSRCSRGRLDVTLTIGTGKGQANAVSWDRSLARRYYRILQDIQREFQIDQKVDVSLLASFRDIFSVKEGIGPDKKCEAVMKRLMLGALDHLDRMRRREGKVLLTDISNRVKSQARIFRNIQLRLPKVVEGYYQRMKERIQLLSGSHGVDQARLAQELAIFADRCDVTEEMIRSQSHLNQFTSLLKKREPVGRQLDFLLQEMGREINTIGSKANDAEISSCVVQLKSGLEKIREQVQNVE